MRSRIGLMITVLACAILLAVPAAALAYCAPPTTTGGTTTTWRGTCFRDMPGGCWYASAVTGLTQRGIIGGYADGTFRADQTITRAQYAAMLGRMLGVSSGGTARFSDVRGTWAEGWIAALSQRGIMTGYPNGTFHPNDQITRGQACAFIARALHLPNTWDGTVHFPDLNGQWMCGYAQQLWSRGIISGTTDGMFGPYGHITRAQAAVMMWRCPAPYGAGV